MNIYDYQLPAIIPRLNILTLCSLLSFFLKAIMRHSSVLHQYLLFRNSNTASPVFSFAGDATSDTLQYCFVESANATVTSGAVVIGSAAAIGLADEAYRAVGAEAWPSGDQVWNGQTGTLMAKAITNRNSEATSSGAKPSWCRAPPI